MRHFEKDVHTNTQAHIPDRQYLVASRVDILIICY